MTLHPVALAFPNGTTSADAIRLKLAAAFALVFLDPDDVEDMNFSATDAVAVPNLILAKVSGLFVPFFYDATDVSSLHNGVTVLVSNDGKRFLAALAPGVFVNVISRTNTPPVSPAAGDKYIVGLSPTGAWASNADDNAIFDGQDWVFVSPEIGQRVYVRDEDLYYYWAESGDWLADELDSGVGASALEFPWGMPVESVIATPPGTRATGATPTMPLGGTAANINDDNTATTTTTSALGDLSAAALSGRIVAQLDLGSVQALAAIEIKQAKRSASSNSGWALYYSSDGSSYTALGTTFSLTATETDISRSGTFNARYVALVAPQANYSTVTVTLSDLNAYKQATSVADGTKYIVAPNGIGVFSGQDNKIAEARGGIYSFFTPYDAAFVLDRSRKVPLRYDATLGTWPTAGGAWVGYDKVFTASGSVGSATGTGAYTYSASTAPAAQRRKPDNVTLTYTAKAAGKRLRFRYRCSNVSSGSGGVTVASDGPPVAALYRDSITDALDWVPIPTAAALLEFSFEIDAPDAGAHTYKVVFLSGASSGFFTDIDPGTRRLLTVEEGS